ncbi:MAG: hypothetical protein AB8B91_00210 [Rubripirellula sp.]
MAGDLEDFLRRAAERRQAKAAQQQQQQPPAPRETPQYTDRRTERLARIPDDEEILTAEIVEPPTNTYAAQIQRVEDARREASRIQNELQRKQKKQAAKSKRDQKSADAKVMTGHPATDLIRLMRSNGGIQQAILLREIFDRPEHRW